MIALIQDVFCPFWMGFEAPNICMSKVILNPRSHDTIGWNPLYALRSAQISHIGHAEKGAGVFSPRAPKTLSPVWGDIWPEENNEDASSRLATSICSSPLQKQTYISSSDRLLETNGRRVATLGIDHFPDPKHTKNGRILSISSVVVRSNSADLLWRLSHPRGKKA